MGLHAPFQGVFVVPAVNNVLQDHRVPSRYDIEPPRKQARVRLSTLENTYLDYLKMDNLQPFWVTLATYAANMLPIETSLWLLLVGPPSCGKSATLSALNKLPRVFPTGTLTEAGLLSGSVQDTRADDGHGGLLDQIGPEIPGLICCKDYGSILSMGPGERQKLLAALREIYDGHWVRRLGSGGGITREWKGKAGLIGGVTPTIDKNHSAMASMGERFLMLRFHSTLESRLKQAEMALSTFIRQPEAREQLQGLTTNFMQELDIPNQRIVPLPTRIEKLILDLSHLISTSRSAVDRDCREKHVARPPEPEFPNRLAQQFVLLFHGLILIGCRAQEAWKTLFEVGLSSMPVTRRRILQRLAATEGELPTRTISESTKCSKKTTNRELESLLLLEVLEVRQKSGSAGSSWRLSDWARECYSKCEQGISDVEREVELALYDPLLLPEVTTRASP
ncbi:MAG: hypothetical protein R6U36_11260 [Candidatus Fermentibacteraceae bacterium]